MSFVFRTSELRANNIVWRIASYNDTTHKKKMNIVLNNLHEEIEWSKKVDKLNRFMWWEKILSHQRRKGKNELTLLLNEKFTPYRFLQGFFYKIRIKIPEKYDYVEGLFGVPIKIKKGYAEMTRAWSKCYKRSFTNKKILPNYLYRDSEECGIRGSLQYETKEVEDIMNNKILMNKCWKAWAN